MACIGEITFFSGRWADVELEEARLGWCTDKCT
jgi:hypothetical protein